MRPTLIGRILLMVVPWIGLAVLTRPCSADWPAAVARMRRKERHGAGTMTLALEPVRAVWDTPERWQALLAMARERFAFGIERFPEEERGLWALDSGVLTVACTKKRCYVGALGSWRKLPGGEYDLYALAALHGFACLISHKYGPTVFFRHFAPRLVEPHTVLGGAFATSSPFEMLWLGSTLLGLGHELQRALGRGGFLALWLAGAVGMSLAAAVLRHTCTGTGGILASFTYHTIAAPHARHSLYGIEMGARQALAVHVGIACLPAFQGASRPHVAIGLSLLPLVIGAAFHQLGWLR